MLEVAVVYSEWFLRTFSLCSICGSGVVATYIECLENIKMFLSLLC